MDYIRDHRFVMGAKILIAGLTIMMILSGCGWKKRPYDFMVKNTTSVSIRLLVVDEFGKDPRRLSLGPKEDSGIFSKQYQPNCLCFDAPGISIGVKEFADSTGNHENSISTWFQINSLSQTLTNTIVISLSPPSASSSNNIQISID